MVLKSGLIDQEALSLGEIPLTPLVRVAKDKISFNGMVESSLGSDMPTYIHDEIGSQCQMGDFLTMKGKHSAAL